MRKASAVSVLPLVAVVVIAVPLRSHGAPRPSEPLPRTIGSGLVLFVDDWLIDRMDDVGLRLHRPVRKETVFRFDAPWEGPQSGYATVFKDGQQVRMYYRGGGDLSRECTCLATSDDGIHWTRPLLGLFEFDGSTDNNIVWTGHKKAYWESHNFSPFKDTNPAAPPARRYKAVTLSRHEIDGETRKVLMGFVSPDGVRWTRLQETPVITEGSFDSHNTAFWDTVRGRYVCYLRHGRQGVRSVMRATSPDFVHWSKPEWLDFGHAPLEQFYTNGIVQYFRAPHLYLGFPMRFVPERTTIGLPPRDTDGLSDAVLISSHDGLHWHRAFMEAFIRPGLDPANWGNAHGNNTPMWGLVQTGPAEISVYWLENYGAVPSVRRGAVRLDGFGSVNASHRGGEFVTRPLVFEGRSLFVNVATSAVGGVKVEMQDAEGEALPGFELQRSIEIYGDELERVVAWENGAAVSTLAGRPVRIRFVMKDADLYSIRFGPPAPLPGERRAP
ncbi:MAG: hypothetical protein JSV19_09935 [Phycisphaerales bacterium]|nr:MAG: hypothetical protein JSV19_09935 [Phycisphaerales bacterium]